MTRPRTDPNFIYMLNDVRGFLQGTGRGGGCTRGWQSGGHASAPHHTAVFAMWNRGYISPEGWNWPTRRRDVNASGPTRRGRSEWYLQAGARMSEGAARAWLVSRVGVAGAGQLRNIVRRAATTCREAGLGSCSGCGGMGAVDDLEILKSNACYAQRLGWRVRPAAEGFAAYPYAERDPALARDVAQVQTKVGIDPNGVLGPTTLQAMVGIVREWQGRGEPEVDELGQTLVRRLILPGIENAPSPHPEVECEAAYAGTEPFGGGKSSNLTAGLWLVALGGAIWWLYKRYPGK